MRSLGRSKFNHSNVKNSGLGPQLDIRIGGTFTRATEASYLFGAATDGSTPFMSWSVANEARFENRGDGFGGGWYLTEVSGTNQLLRSQSFTSASWVATNCTPTDNAGNAPDGSVTAASISYTANATAQMSQSLSFAPADSANAVFTIWMRSAAPQTVRMVLKQKDAATEGAAVTCNTTTTWQRFELNQSVGTGTNNPAFIIRNAADAAARTVFMWGAQVEVNGTFCRAPTSYMRTTSTVVIRGADDMNFSTTKFPSNFTTRGMKIIFIPDESSTELVARGQSEFLGCFGNSNDAVDMGSGGSFQFLGRNSTNNAFAVATWSRNQKLTIEGNRQQACVIGDGATTGGGRGTTALANQPFGLTPATIHIGNQNGAAGWFCGRIFPVITSLPDFK